MSKEIVVLELADPGQWPEAAHASRPHLLLLCWNADRASSANIYSLAERALAQGAVYVCSWGVDCERVHDVFDEAIVGDGSGPIERLNVTTTWHEDESLEEVVEYALSSARLGTEAGALPIVAATIADAGVAMRLRVALKAAQA